MDRAPTRLSRRKQLWDQWPEASSTPDVAVAERPDEAPSTPAARPGAVESVITEWRLNRGLSLVRTEGHAGCGCSCNCS